MMISFPFLFFFVLFVMCYASASILLIWRTFRRFWICFYFFSYYDSLFYVLKTEFLCYLLHLYDILPWFLNFKSLKLYFFFFTHCSEQLYAFIFLNEIVSFIFWPQRFTFVPPTIRLFSFHTFLLSFHFLPTFSFYILIVCLICVPLMFFLSSSVLPSSNWFGKKFLLCLTFSISHPAAGSVTEQILV